VATAKPTVRLSMALSSVFRRLPDAMYAARQTAAVKANRPPSGLLVLGDVRDQP
jgi:hypothetical protein